ncbi:MAG TPA: amino acid adenylation domain-containing protein, partial [Thermoanaerobaculia bacterium]|nr:amino acid adenylation domain-containing protein [Thermoanaerobaculia bacterium]
ERAGDLARHLVAAGVGPEEVVGLCLDRSPEMVAAILGVLAAGAAYLPLESVHPPERLAWMAADAGARWIVTREPRARLARAIAEARREGAARLLDLDEVSGAGEGPRGEVPLEALAYVLYTSGSTGTPKGVMLPHRALSNYLSWAGKAYGMSDGLGAPVHSPLGFDLTVTSLFLPLLAGGTVTLLPEEQGVEALRDVLREDHRFGLLKLTPAHLAFLGETLGEADLTGRAGALVVGGEALLAEVVTAWRARETGPGPRARVINEYGPTEAAVGCSVHELPPEAAVHGALPIGRPIANARIHLLGPDLRPVPLGAPGEIAIGGGGLARGYRGRPDLTALRFVPDPVSDRPGERLYRSGDLARRLGDGDLVFLGRRDRQVKIRGFRIELAEVEAALTLHPEVTEAVAVAFPGDGGPRLAAYVVPREGGGVPAGLPDFLARRLPGHMIPTALMALPALPLTANGKVDLEALPRPETAGLPDGGYVAPRTSAEERLAVLWEEVLSTAGLRRGPVGVLDSFFGLGGHSLLAARLIGRVREALGIELPLASLFQEPTVAGMARRLEEAGAAAVVPEETIPRRSRQARDRPLPLSFAQERLWFLERLDPGTPLYHVAVALRAQGDLRPEALAAALTGVVRRHEALRTAFPAAQGVPVQAVAAPEESRVAVPKVDLSALPAARREGEAAARLRELARRPFDLARGPLLAARLFHLGAGESVVLVVLHHLVSDGWSMGVLIREVKALYGAAVPELPPLSIQYADYAAWQRQRLQGERLAAELSWWRERLAGAPPGLDLPLDRPRPAVPSRAGATRPFRLPEEAVQALALRASATPFMTVLAAFQTLLSRLAGQRDLTVGVPVAGRLRPETEGLIGLFVNTLALRAELPPGLTFLEALARARAAVLEAHAHQEIPFERLVEELQPERDLSRTPLFQVMLAPRGTPAAGLDLPGVHLRPAAVDTGTAKFDLTLFLSEGDGLGEAFEHSTELFDGTTIERWAGHLITLLTTAAAEPERQVADLPLLSPAERHQLLVERGEAEGVVLDERGYPVPPGVVGELWLAGEPRRRTGHLARTRPDGRLEHLGSSESREEARRQEAPAREPAEPRTPTEREVAAIWREVLGIEQALLGRSFFDLGGHSLLAARALARIEEQFGVELPLRQLYGAPTIETLAEAIDEALLARADDARLDELLDALEGVDDPALLEQLLASEEGTGAGD